MCNDNTKRFSNRVDDYVKYRPHYPIEIIFFLQNTVGLSTERLIVDIGAGTGISTSLFLNAGYTVIAVEPNNEMRNKAMEQLHTFSGFSVSDGTAENTKIPNKTADVIVAGQAFHWFNVEKAKFEFKRILREDGIVILIWNERKTESLFEKEYEKLILKHGKDYQQVDHRNIDYDNLKKFYHPASVQLKVFPNNQELNFEQLKGRLLSSSYMPSKTDEGYEAMIADLEKLFADFKENDVIYINYETKVYYGQV